MIVAALSHHDSISRLVDDPALAAALARQLCLRGYAISVRRDGGEALVAPMPSACLVASRLGEGVALFVVTLAPQDRNNWIVDLFPGELGEGWMEVAA